MDELSTGSSKGPSPLTGITRRRVEEKVQEFIKRLFDARNEVVNTILYFEC